MDAEFDIPRAEEYLTLLRKRLPDKTYDHVQSVARTMLTFAEEAGITREQAITAGLLHDSCKAFQREELLKRAGDYGISDHLDNPNLLHGPVAAAECRELLGIVDADVLEAIRYHTTGHGGWSKVGSALYIADFAEPLRRMPQSKIARDMLVSDGFCATLRYVTEQKVAHVKERFTLDSDTRAFADWILQEPG
ncbi:MAG: bis(5'-nucleosyl)-tetraphosphatase (symmetrical) YqeK [Candidatus Hydrogenedentota bacterium]